VSVLIILIMAVINVLQEGLEIERKYGSQTSWWKQLSTLTRRSFVNMCRDVGYYWLRIIAYIIISICIGTLFFDVGYSYTSILARGTCSAFITGFMTTISVGGFPSAIEEMKVTKFDSRNETNHISQ